MPCIQYVTLFPLSLSQVYHPFLPMDKKSLHHQSIKVRGGKRLTRYRLHCGAAAADVGLRRTLLQALVRRGDQLPGVDLGRISAGIHCRQHA